MQTTGRALVAMQTGSGKMKQSLWHTSEGGREGRRDGGRARERTKDRGIGGDKADHSPSPPWSLSFSFSLCHKHTSKCPPADRWRKGREDRGDWGREGVRCYEKAANFYTSAEAERWLAKKKKGSAGRKKEAHRTSSAVRGTFGGLLRQIQCGERENVQWLVATDVGDRQMNLTRGSRVRHRLE